MWLNAKSPARLISAVIASASLTGSLMVVQQAAATAVSVCPTVDSITHVVSPAASPGVVWSGCDLTGADLTGADFTGAQLMGAHLDRAILVRSEMTDADLTGATHVGADFTDVIWSNTTCFDGVKCAKHVGGTCLGALDLAAPRVHVIAPHSAIQRSTTIVVRWTARDLGSGVASSDVRYRSRPRGAAAYSSWASLVSETKARTASLVDATVGTRYCFEVRARDNVGAANVSAWSAPACTTIGRSDR